MLARPILRAAADPSAAQSAAYAKEASAHLTRAFQWIVRRSSKRAPGAFRSPRGIRGAVFTSENSVDAFAARGLRPARAAPGLVVRHAHAARHCSGRFTKVISAAQTVAMPHQGLLALLIRTRPTPPLLHLRGAHARAIFAPRLTPWAACDAAILYDHVLACFQ